MRRKLASSPNPCRCRGGYLPLHLVGLVTLAQTERAGEVAGKHIDLLDAGDQGLVDSLLVCRSAAADLLLLYAICQSPSRVYRCGNQTYLWLLSLLEESLLTGLLRGTVAGEVLLGSDLVNLLGVEAGQVDLVRGGDDVSGVDAAQRDTVDLERASDQEDTLLEVLEEDNALAAETASEQDQNGTGLEGGARSPGADSLADLLKKSQSTIPKKKHVLGPSHIKVAWRLVPLAP